MIEFVQMDATRLSFHKSFDAIGAFDVVEHIDADEQVMQQVWKGLKKEGLFFLTVPQNACLWSATDDKGCHKRRYTRADLRKKLETAGFRVRWMSSFVTLLLPIMALSRLGAHRAGADRKHDAVELQLPPWLDRLCEITLRGEEMLIRCGVSLPAGGSLAVVAQKCGLTP